jgi:hypothetical protein
LIYRSLLNTLGLSNKQGVHVSRRIQNVGPFNF